MFDLLSRRVLIRAAPFTRKKYPGARSPNAGIMVAPTARPEPLWERRKAVIIATDRVAPISESANLDHATTGRSSGFRIILRPRLLRSRASSKCACSGESNGIQRPSSPITAAGPRWIRTTFRSIAPRRLPAVTTYLLFRLDQTLQAACLGLAAGVSQDDA